MQTEVMSLRGSQWLQRFHEQAQSGQTVEQWCKEQHVSCSTYYRWKKALREKVLAQMEAEKEQAKRPVSATVSQREPQFAALVVPEAGRDETHTSDRNRAGNGPVIRIRIGKSEIEVPEGIEAGHLEMVLKAVRDAG